MWRKYLVRDCEGRSTWLTRLGHLNQALIIDPERVNWYPLIAERSEDGGLELIDLLLRLRVHFGKDGDHIGFFRDHSHVLDIDGFEAMYN